MCYLTIFRAKLWGSKAAILGWGVSLGGLAAYLAALHDAFISQQEQFQNMLSAYPPELMAAFGGTTDLFIPSGFLNFTFFSYAAVLLAFLAISMGSGLLAADEERGRLDLLAAYPLTRLGLFTARLLAAFAGMVLILFLSWLGFVLSVGGTGLEGISPAEFALPHLELLVLMGFFTGLALLLSQVLPGRGWATALAAAYLLASYVLQSFLQLDDSLAGLQPFSPLHYIKGGYAIDGVDLGRLAGLLAAGLLFILLAAWRFQSRDLRVAGEGSWPDWLRIPKKAQKV